MSTLLVMAATELKPEVTCSICKNIYTDPITLFCGHSFCQVCITRTFDTQEDRQDREYFCPECLKRFSRRPELQKSTRLCNIADHFHSVEPKGKQPEKVCSYCVNFPVPAVSLCLHCEAFLCVTHKEKHSRSSEHVLVNPTTSLEDRKCPIHKRILEYYCTMDGTCICSHCLTSDHNGHKVSTISEFLEQKAKNLGPILENLSAKRKETEAMIESLQDNKRKINEKADGVAVRVTAIMRDIRRQLEDLEKRVLTEIPRQKQKISLSISNHVLQLEKEKSELHKKITQIEELSRNINPISILQTPDVLVSSLKDEHNLDTGIGSKLIHDAGDLEMDVVFETLHSGLSNIIEVVGKDVHAKDAQKSSLFGGNKNIGKRNVSKEAQTTKGETNAQVRSYYPSRAQIKSKTQNGPLIPANKSSTTEMLLDVNTASNYLDISDDLKTVSRSDVYLGRPETLKRFQSPQVLSIGAISSGKLVLEMEISKTKGCSGDSLFIGMCYHTIDRRGSQSLTEGSSIAWGLWIKDIAFKVVKNKKMECIRNVSSQRIKLSLDYKAGQLSFYELCEPTKHIHTFTAAFTQPLHLIISLQGSCWVKILK
ncbi:E3 ubiquitin/ISG15 ligase TRIM25-like [Aquarana catesbeiana]|uniref:E3 ubiquitin/ISG15 ligase TRIM25-like n=1 Tax=Aquarana catesbeiana TaxID=8400 RepID=UPI003CC99E67